MDLSFQEALAADYKSGGQRARILSEHWLGSQLYCPNCGNPHIERYRNNRPVGDFFCPACKEDYELKSKRSHFGAKVDDGGYRTMIQCVTENTNPNFFFVNYNARNLIVTDLFIIPAHFFSRETIEERRPLSPTAQRKGWIGCRILLQGIPYAGRISIVRNGVIERKADVLERWQRTLFLRSQRDSEAKGWLLHVMRCIEQLGKRQFSLDDVYSFESTLGNAYPGNRHVRAKIRQKLQVLRDSGYLDFVGRGIYRLTDTSS
jgi:type II restriction enzyme